MDWKCFKPYADPQEMLRKEMDCQDIHAENFVPQRESSRGRDEEYIACASNGDQFALVGIGEWQNSNYCVIVMHEQEGPQYHNAARDVLNDLSPTTSEFARRWRQESCLRSLHGTTIEELVQVPSGWALALHTDKYRYRILLHPTEERIVAISHPDTCGGEWFPISGGNLPDALRQFVAENDLQDPNHLVPEKPVKRHGRKR